MSSEISIRNQNLPNSYLLEIKKKETLDAVQELQAACKRIYFPKDRPKSRPSEEPPQRTAFHEPHIFTIKKKHKEPIDLIVKGVFWWSKEVQQAIRQNYLLMMCL